VKIYLKFTLLSFVIHGIKCGQPNTCSKVAILCLCVDSIWIKFPGKCQFWLFLESGPLTLLFFFNFFFFLFFNPPVNWHSNILTAVSGWGVESLLVKTTEAIGSGSGLSFKGLLRFLNKYHQIVFWNMNFALGHQFLEPPIKHSPQYFIVVSSGLWTKQWSHHDKFST